MRQIEAMMEALDKRIEKVGAEHDRLLNLAKITTYQNERDIRVKKASDKYIAFAALCELREEYKRIIAGFEETQRIEKSGA